MRVKNRSAPPGGYAGRGSNVDQHDGTVDSSRPSSFVKPSYAVRHGAATPKEMLSGRDDHIQLVELLHAAKQRSESRGDVRRTAYFELLLGRARQRAKTSVRLDNG